MKHLLQYITLCLLVAFPFTGCHKQSPVAEKLRQAENIMFTSPDSALQMLEGISQPELLTGQVQADYALLLTQARHRCNVIAVFNSLIHIAVDFFCESRKQADECKGMVVFGQCIYRY